MSATQSIKQDHEEADERNNEGESDGAAVNDQALKRRNDGAAENSHNQAGGTNFRIRSHLLERQTINGRKHERHESGYTDQEEVQRVIGPTP